MTKTLFQDKHTNLILPEVRYIASNILCHQGNYLTGEFTMKTSKFSEKLNRQQETMESVGTVEKLRPVIGS